MKQATKKTTKKTKEVEAKQEDVFTVVVDVNSHKYTTTGATAFEALRKIKPENYKTKAIITVTKGDKSVERVLSLQKLKMLNFQSEIPTQVLAKNLTFLMGL